MHIQITNTELELASSLKNIIQDKVWQKLLIQVNERELF